MKTLPLDPTPFLLGIILTPLCFVLFGRDAFQACVWAATSVPISILTYLTLRSRRAVDGLPTFDLLLATAGLTVVFSVWFMLVVSLTLIFRETGAVYLMLLGWIGLVCSLLLLWAFRSDGSASGESTWRRLFRFLLTIRGMFVLVAVVALVLWPIHLLRMRPTYSRIANDESVLGNLCDAESSLMAERARLCRERSARGVAWDLDDDDSQTLKICPYPNDGPGRSWLHQAEIWDRASERSRMAAVRHEWTAGWYAPWRLP